MHLEVMPVVSLVTHAIRKQAKNNSVSPNKWRNCSPILKDTAASPFQILHYSPFMIIYPFHLVTCWPGTSSWNKLRTSEIWDFMAVSMMLLFRVFVQCSFVFWCEHFIEKYCLHLQGWNDNAPSPYYPSSSQFCNLSPEDGASIFLRNVGIALRNYAASKPKSITT